MSESTLHPTPRLSGVVREQIRAVGLSLRPQALVAAMVIGIVSLLIVIDIFRGKAATWFDSNEGPESIIPVLFFLLPFAIWRKEKPFGPAFLWTLPVDRRRLALLKVFAGWVWLMTGLAALVSWELLLAVLAGVPNPQTLPFLWFVAGTALYLLGSAMAIGLRHPLLWLAGCAGLVFLLGAFNDVIDRKFDPILQSRSFASAVEGAMPLLYILSLAAGLAALWIAASRHREERRR